jgi:hypothetical protein
VEKGDTEQARTYARLRDLFGDASRQPSGTIE